MAPAILRAEDASIYEEDFGRPAQEVFVATSRLALSRPQDERQIKAGHVLSMLESMSGIVLSHWALEVADTFFDLKRHGMWPLATATFEASPRLRRKEGLTMERISIGHTHCNESEISEVGESYLHRDAS
jgi:hypothetical protein